MGGCHASGIQYSVHLNMQFHSQLHDPWYSRLKLHPGNPHTLIKNFQSSISAIIMLRLKPGNTSHNSDRLLSAYSSTFLIQVAMGHHSRL